MTTQHQVAILIGSLRKNGYSQRLAETLMQVAPDRLVCRIVGIGDLPFYNDDLEKTPPPAWMDFRQAIESSNAVLFVTPEYNRSCPAALKNALDVGSRPYGKNVFDGLPSAVISHSVGALGGFGANQAVRQILVPLNMPTLQQPEAYISNIGTLFNADGVMKDTATTAFLVGFMATFDRWIIKNKMPSRTNLATIPNKRLVGLQP
jgi:chromate reductase, NAD(P)H dehydrogenase (quinone)